MRQVIRDCESAHERDVIICGWLKEGSSDEEVVGVIADDINIAIQRFLRRDLLLNIFDKP